MFQPTPPTKTVPETAAEPQAPSVKKARMAEPAASSAAAATYSEAEVAAMSARQYMDELVVPTLLRALASVNKEVRRGLFGIEGFKYILGLSLGWVGFTRSTA